MEGAQSIKLYYWDSVNKEWIKWDGNLSNVDVKDLAQRDLTQQMLEQLKLMNTYLSKIINEELNETDIIKEVK